jgi:dihydroorotate dehydrogenase electron transfer subunit
MERNVFQLSAQVAANAPAGRRYLRMALAAPEIAARAEPGQFVNLRVTRGLDPLLGRPFSVLFADRGAGTVEILYKPAGRGTAMLAEVRPGERLGLVGPLGRGFAVASDVEVHVAVGGGTGLAPVYFLAARLAAAGAEAHLLFGFRDCSFGLPEELMSRAGARLHLASDAGEAGCHRGTAVDLLRAVLDGELAGRRAAVYAAGPAIMMKLAFEEAARRALPCQASLEAHMACGLSVCRGCLVAVKGTAPDGAPLRRPVCTYGPVFQAAEVDWDRYVQ